MKRIVLIGCGKEKQLVACAAKELYIGPLFTARRRYAERSGRPWLIVSALHWVLRPSRVIEPYDKRMPIALRLAYDWALCFRNSLTVTITRAPTRWVAFNPVLGFREPVCLEIHAGADYVNPIQEAFRGNRMIGIEHPVAGMGIGEQLRFYKEQIR
jgi:hypothetical protein